MTNPNISLVKSLYAAFQGGLWQMTGEGRADGARRTARRVGHYRAALRRAAGLATPPAAADAPAPPAGAACR